MTRPTFPSIVVLGGGLAGLTAANRLASDGARVTLIEREPALGGRTIQSIQGLGSGPFVTSESHHATLALWRSLHAQPHSATLSHVSLEFLLPDGRVIPYSYTPLPMPFHLVLSLLRFGGFTWQERWRLITWLEQIWEAAIHLPSDLVHRTAEEWLDSLGQGHRARRTVWDPLAQWLTGNQLTTLSADAFCSVMRSTFCSAPSASRWTIAPIPFRESLIQPLIDKLRASGATILLNSEVTRFLTDGDRMIGVVLRNGSTLQGDVYLAALPRRQLAPLLPERWLSRYAYFQQLADLSEFPTMAVQVTIRRTLTVPRIVLMHRDPFHSVVVQPSGSNNIVCRFIGRDEAADAPPSSEALQPLVEDILRSLRLLSVGESLTSLTYEKDPDGVLSLGPGMQLGRPLQRSPIANLLVAGAWTDSGWPPNVESAIVSADRCTEIIAGLAR